MLPQTTAHATLNTRNRCADDGETKRQCEPVLSASDLEFSYRSKQANGSGINQIGPLNITLREGETTALIGPSGCGKSTTLRLLAGILKPSNGHVSYRGKHLDKLRETQLAALRRSEFAFIFQDYMLIDSLSVAENVALPLRLAKQQYRDAEVRRALASVNLSPDLAGASVTELSGGQQQRVAIARALMMRADVLFADEPTGNLDPQAREDILAALANAMQGGLKTCLLVTHDPQVAATADRILLMKQGNVVNEFSALAAGQIERLLLKDGALEEGM